MSVYFSKDFAVYEVIEKCSLCSDSHMVLHRQVLSECCIIKEKYNLLSDVLHIVDV
jgi:hypothetical protein